MFIKPPLIENMAGLNVEELSKRNALSQEQISNENLKRNKVRQ